MSKVLIQNKNWICVICKRFNNLEIIHLFGKYLLNHYFVP